MCELVSCGTILLAFLFGPKIYILLSYEPVVVEYKSEAVATQNGLFEKGKKKWILTYSARLNVNDNNSK